MQVQPFTTRVFKENENLFDFVVEYLPTTIPEKSIVVVTSKIIALSEGRTAIVKDDMEREQLIRTESQWAMRTKYTWLTIKDNMVMASAGIDASNADDKIILLPKDSFESAEILRQKICKHYNVRDVGVLVTDSRLLPLRNGIVGVALGYAGIKGIRDYRGTVDMFGRTLKLARVDVADSLATAAVLEMGEGAEQQPLAMITEARVDFIEKVDRTELHIDPKEDVYQPLFEDIHNIDLGD